MNERSKKKCVKNENSLKVTDNTPIGDSDKFSTVARSSSTDAEILSVPLLSGLIST